MHTPISSRSSVPGFESPCTVEPTTPRRMHPCCAIRWASVESGSLLFETPMAHLTLTAAASAVLSLLTTPIDLPSSRGHHACVQQLQPRRCVTGREMHAHRIAGDGSWRARAWGVVLARATVGVV